MAKAKQAKKPAKPETCKCAWCGSVQPVTAPGGTGTTRLRQHKNGVTTCVGSAQPVQAHERLRAAAAQGAASGPGKSG